MKRFFPLALAVAAVLALGWLQRNPSVVLDETHSSEEESLEPEFAVHITEPDRRPPLQRIPSPASPTPSSSDPEEDQAPAQEAAPNADATPRPDPSLPEKPQASGPREEIVGGVKNVYGEDGMTLLETGGWQNEKRQGYWQRFDADGRVIATENYVDGVLEGLSESWYPDGKRRSSVPMQAGKVHGRAQYWLPSGELDSARSGTYEDGERVSD